MEITPNVLDERRRAKRYADSFGEWADSIADIEKIFKHFQTHVTGQDPTAAAMLTISTVLTLETEENQ